MSWLLEVLAYAFTPEDWLRPRTRLPKRDDHFRNPRSPTSPVLSDLDNAKRANSRGQGTDEAESPGE